MGRAFSKLTSGFNCDGTCVDTDMDGVCDFDEVPGCQDPNACNFNAEATDGPVQGVNISLTSGWLPRRNHVVLDGWPGMLQVYVELRLTTSGPLTGCCYSIIGTDSYGDGWNGAVTVMSA